MGILHVRLHNANFLGFQLSQHQSFYPASSPFARTIQHPLLLPQAPSTSSPAMRTASTSGPVNMCRLLIHKYSCGHSKTDLAPCAGHRGGHCSGTTEKTVSHKEKCARCGKCSCSALPCSRPQHNTHRSKESTSADGTHPFLFFAGFNCESS